MIVSLGLLLLVLLPARLAAAEPATVELIPADRSSWRLEKLWTPLTAWFTGGSGFWYGDRAIEIETNPPGATLELSYVRENFQKRFERAVSPIHLVLPSRIEAERGDSVAVRAVLDGHRDAEVRFDVRSRETELTIELAPLPNTLESVTHRYLPGRGSLEFLTREPLRFRIQDMKSGFSIALIDTRRSAAAAMTLEGISSAQIKWLRSEQLGEDLIVSIELDEPDRCRLERRSNRGYDAARDLHQFTVDLVPSAETQSRVKDLRGALARIRPEDVSGCALEFDRSLRHQLEPEALARALAPSSSFLDPYLQDALERLGQLSPDGVVSFADGSRFRASRPLELTAASARSAEAQGYLALLKKWVEEIEPTDDRNDTLRGIIAPGMTNADFDAIVEIAEDTERHCSAGIESPNDAVPR